MNLSPVNQFLCLASLVVGGVAMVLVRPHPVWVEAVNTCYVLKWDWDQMQANHTVTFTADYRLSNQNQYKVACNRTVQHQCDFTHLNLNYVASYVLRVRAEDLDEVSGWSQVSFAPDDNASLGPPSQVKVISSDSMLTVQITDPMTSQNVSMETIGTLWFAVNYWEEHSPLQIQTQVSKTQRRVVLSSLKPWTRYCVQVNAFSKELEKTSTFTAKQCVSTKGKGLLSWHILLLLLFGFSLVAIPVLYFRREIKNLFPVYDLPSTIQSVPQAVTPLLELPEETFTILDALEQAHHV